MRTKALLAALALSLSACATMVDGGFAKLKPGIATVSDVEAQVGKPNYTWKNTDGSQQWEYSDQPSQQVTYMVLIAPDNKVLTVDQVLTREQAYKVKAGMTEDEVRRLLGAPGSKTPNLKNEITWDWNAPDWMDGFRQHFLVYFNRAGRVTRTDILTFQEN